MTSQSPVSPAGRLLPVSQREAAYSPQPAPHAGFKREWLTAPSSESSFVERMHWNETLPAQNPKGFSIDWDAQPTLSKEEQLEKRGLELKACYNISGSIIPIAWLCTDPDIVWAFTIAGPCNADGTKTIYCFHQFATIDLWSLKSHTSFTSTEDFLRNYDGRKAVEVDKVDGGKQKLYEAYTTAGIPYDVQTDKRAPDEPYSDEDASGY
ncbi:hypothetical protein C8R43DRAFT_1108151 [Mycena crocata]|nr:hypothetical protein C8R43DRAFT_1108151 [Mycena crocata]